MTVTLIFLLVVIGVAGWWLSHQRLTSKPWLESGPDAFVEGTDSIGLPKGKMGLVVFLGVVGTLFALFTSGFLIRMETGDWRSMPLPRIIWANTILLALSSVSLQFALVAARKFESGATRYWLVVSGISAVAFLVGQILAWQYLSENGFYLTGNPANSFFYLITGIHGLHIAGGMVALSRTTLAAWVEQPSNALRQRIDLCALYWHFLLFVWFALLAVMLGAANGILGTASH